MNSVLSVGAVIAAHTPAVWVCNLLLKLKLNPRIDLRAVIVIPEAGVRETQHSTSPLLSAGKWLLLKKIDKPLFSQNPWQSQTVADNITVLEHTDAANALEQCQVVLNLCKQDLPRELFNNPDTCIWSTQLNTLNERIEHALLEQAPLTWVHLWSQTASTAGKRSPAKLIASHALPRQTFSLTDLRRAAFFSLPSLFSSRLNWLAQHSDLLDLELDNPAISCAAICEERTLHYQQAKSLAETQYKPKAYSDALYLFRAIQLWYRQTLRRISDRFWIEQWQLAVSDHDQHSATLICDIADTKLEDYRAIPSPRNLLRADPHMLEYAGNSYVLFEEMATTGSKAHISGAKLDETGQLIDQKVVLQEEQHLSYPFIFSHEGVQYMIPETASRKTVSLYRAHDFPERWERVSNLLNDINVADTTVLFHKDRWWMFTNTQSHRVVDERDELLIYYADTLEGPWQEHPLNPVLTGVDRARMAGPIMNVNGELFRSSQYGAVRYGRGINLNRIEQLDTTHYRETPIARILPERGSPWEGCHSITRLQGLTIIDRVRRQRR